MPKSENDDELLAAARNGDADARARLIERYRGTLNAQTDRELDSRLQVRAGASDMFQQTALSAVHRVHAFRGTTMAEFMGWLKTLHRNNLLDVVRNNKNAEIRSVGKEKSIDGLPGEAAVMADRSVPTPSRIMQADETVADLHTAIQELPDDQRQVLRLRLLEELPIAAIAEQLQRTEDSIAGLFKRGLVAVRRRMDPDRLSVD
ncbi:MAG: sigma-70 family RNA polymerase sigma factor [Fuerstiella sp.]|nr:sigma-70 family RNA polymerase sigma factor [Fuerstiella sp.]